MSANLDRQPVLLISGYSGAGKTTLIEQIIARLLADNLTVAVIKHDAHGLNVDQTGKDSDRFFRAGATVLAQGPHEAFLRVPSEHAWDIEAAVAHLLRSHDLVLVEGHKRTPLGAKIWLRTETNDPPPPEAGNTIMDLSRDEDRLERVYTFIRPWLRLQGLRTPVHAGILIGGHSSRMGQPKHLIEHNGVTWLEHIAATITPHVDSVVLLGSGELPPSLRTNAPDKPICLPPTFSETERRRTFCPPPACGGTEGGKGVPSTLYPHLSDAPNCVGPLAGMRAAMRWDPAASWLFVACDMPLLTGEAVAWLLDQRAPGRWAVQPRRPDGQTEPLLAWYDYRAANIIEHVSRPKDLATHPRIHPAPIPPELQTAWNNLNTPSDIPNFKPS